MPNSRYYDPPTSIQPVEGVKVKRAPYVDMYTGTAEALSESGLLPLDRFPGQPGLPKQNITYQPHGKRHGEGCMMVFKNPGRTFRIELRISDEEKERRAAERMVVAARRGKSSTTSSGKRLTLDDIANRRVEASGLVVESYLPRFTRYTGSSLQISTAGVLPDSFPGFPKPKAGETWCHAQWRDAHLEYTLSKQYVNGDAQRRADHSADRWVFDVFDERYRFDAYLDRLAA